MKSLPRNLSLFIAIFGALGVCSSMAEDSVPAALKADAKITQEAATKTALAKVPNGKVRSVELEKENGKLIWSFDIATPKSKNITEVQVNAKTGEIVSTETETP